MFLSRRTSYLIMLTGLLLFHNVAIATQYEIIDLTPTNYVNSYSNGLGDGIQVGVIANSQNAGYSVAWYGSSSSYVPFSEQSNFSCVDALAAFGSKQGGYGYPNIPPSGNFIHHALLWSGPTSIAADLNPSGYYSSTIVALDGIQQGGWSCLPSSQNNRRATLWSGTSASAIDLHGMFQNTEVFGVGGGQQVGDGYTSPHSNLHALLWSGSASSIVDLTPVGGQGVANATDGVHQIGAVGYSHYHAAMWNGTASSYHDLNPIGYSDSSLFSISGNIQVGSAVLTSNGQTHAGIWNGTSASFQDINPIGYSYSTTNQINSDGWIIGNGNDGVHDHALL